MVTKIKTVNYNKTLTKLQLQQQIKCCIRNLAKSLSQSSTLKGNNSNSRNKVLENNHHTTTIILATKANKIIKKKE